MTTRLPFKSYHRMARDLFVYPEDMISTPSSQEEIDRFKKYLCLYLASTSILNVHFQVKNYNCLVFQMNTDN